MGITIGQAFRHLLDWSHMARKTCGIDMQNRQQNEPDMKIVPRLVFFQSATTRVSAARSPNLWPNPALRTENSSSGMNKGIKL